MPVSQEALGEITPFLKIWENKPHNQAVEEFASYALEKQGKVDPYYFIADKDGDLFSPSALSKVKKSIRTETKIGRLEAQAFDSISAWFKAKDLGTIAWISPPADVYPVSKIIISSIEKRNDRKRLFNRSILFEWDEQECLKFAQNLSEMSQNRPLLTHLDQVRSTPLILDRDSKFWIHILEELIDDPKLWHSIRTGEDQLAKLEALKEAKSVFRELFSIRPLVDKLNFVKEKVLPMLGNKPTSCPPNALSGTAFQVFWQSALELGSRVSSSSFGKNEWFCESCPVCGSKINCEVKPGESCPNPQCRAVRQCT